MGGAPGAGSSLTLPPLSYDWASWPSPGCRFQGSEEKEGQDVPEPLLAQWASGTSFETGGSAPALYRSKSQNGNQGLGQKEHPENCPVLPRCYLAR